MRASDIKAKLDAVSEAEAARIRASLGLGLETRVDLEMTPEIHALHVQHEAARAAEGLPPAVIEITWTIA